MMIIRRYELTAKEGQLNPLLSALELLATWLLRRDGCKRVEIEQSLDRGLDIIFSEYWRDEDARLAAGIEMSRERLTNIFSSVERVFDKKSVQIRIYDNGHDIF